MLIEIFLTKRSQPRPISTVCVEKCRKPFTLFVKQPLLHWDFGNWETDNLPTAQNIEVEFYGKHAQNLRNTTTNYYFGSRLQPQLNELRNGACHSHFIIFNQSSAVVHSRLRRREEGRGNCRKMDERERRGDRPMAIVPHFSAGATTRRDVWWWNLEEASLWIRWSLMGEGGKESTK